jgi:uncharacterized protein YbjQ (UPF0145 family)
MNTKIKISREGVTVDEFERQDLLKEILKGNVLDSDYYWTEGMEEWKPIRTIMDELAREAAEPNHKAGDRKRSSMVATTAGELAGFAINDYKGIVHGIVVRTPDVLQNLGSELRAQSIGGKQSSLAKMCERTRGEALELMLNQAKSMGANAVIGINYSTCPVNEHSHEVLCFGTAVIITPKNN